MQTSLADFIRDSAHGEEADGILRKCVHCGFCTATCPTYQLLGDELDGPRGRIYLIKQVLEGGAFSDRTRLHLDRCLTCRACETTCPSGVRYGRLVDIGRDVVDERAPRGMAERGFRAVLRAVLAHTTRFAPLLEVGRMMQPLLPGALARKVPPRRTAGDWPAPRHSRRVLALAGCVQPAIAPDIDAAAARVLDRLGLSLVRVTATGCCGAVHQHLSAPHQALDFMRRNIDAWWPEIEAGAEAIVVNASACALMVKDYGHHLRLDQAYADKAARVSAMTRDLVELVGAEDPAALAGGPHAGRKVAFHAPCTLQHGQKLPGRVEPLLQAAGIELVPIADAHLCCGSAGTFSILQPELSGRLLANKLQALEAHQPELIATANVGCLAHLQTGAGRPVVHWIRLLDHAPL